MTIENIGNIESTDNASEAAPSQAGVPVPSGRYRLHPELSTVAFTAKKLGIFTIRGTMRVEAGTFTVAAPVERSSLHAVLAADSFKTPMARRDAHVKGSTLLDVATYPRIEFDSTEVAPGHDGTWEVRGLLSAHGRTAPVALTVTSTNTEGALVRVRATTQVNRRTFGVTAARAAASAVIKLDIEAVGTPVR